MKQPSGTPTQNDAPDEPTIDIPRKKGKHTIPMSHLKIVAGETDAVAYRIAMQIAGRLLDGGLWDGKQPLTPQACGRHSATHQGVHG
jgi:hypothetical protein